MAVARLTLPLTLIVGVGLREFGARVGLGRARSAFAQSHPQVCARLLALFNTSVVLPAWVVRHLRCTSVGL